MVRSLAKSEKAGERKREMGVSDDKRRNKERERESKHKRKETKLVYSLFI